MINTKKTRIKNVALSNNMKVRMVNLDKMLFNILVDDTCICKVQEKRVKLDANYVSIQLLDKYTKGGYGVYYKAKDKIIEVPLGNLNLGRFENLIRDIHNNLKGCY